MDNNDNRPTLNVRIPDLLPGSHLDVSHRKVLPALFLCLLFGVFGTHRFYVGKVGSGMAQMLTFGGLGLWALYDSLLIIMRKFTDNNGAKVRLWF